MSGTGALRRAAAGAGIGLLLASGCGRREDSGAASQAAPAARPGPPAPSASDWGIPGEAARWVSEGVGEYRQGRYHEAASSFLKARDLVPADTRVSTLLGAALTQARQYAPAQEEFRRLLAIHPEAPEPRLGLARIALRLGDYEGATRLFREVLERKPKDPQSLYNLGLVRYRAGDYAEARSLLERLLAEMPGHAEAHYMLGLCFMRGGDDGRAEEELRRAIGLAPENSQAHFNLAKVYARRGKKAEAEQEQEIFVRLWDRQAKDRAAEGNARELFLTGDYAAALKEYERLLAISPESGRYQLGKAQCLLKMKRPEEATAALEKAVASDPKLAEAHYHLAVLYQQRGEEEKSRREREAFDRLEAIGENKTGF
jgi:protein O-GlcNAc transferase